MASNSVTAPTASGVAACVPAGTVTNSGGSYVGGSASVTFQARGTIKLEPGFHAVGGGAPVTFHALAVPQFFTLGVPASAPSLAVGQRVSFPVTVNPVGGYSGTVVLAAASVPAGMSVTFAPQAVTLSGGISYDVENRTGGASYSLENQPILKWTGDQAHMTWYLFGQHGERLATFTTQGNSCQYDTTYYLIHWACYENLALASRNIYFAGRLIQSNGKTVVSDRLGSVRANESGETFEYLPYGEEITVKNPQDREKFGTYTRDSATGLDYADQRCYDSVHGVFTAADRDHQSATSPADVNSPGSWNRYVYAGGDPVNKVDPTGTLPIFGGEFFISNGIGFDWGLWGWAYLIPDFFFDVPQDRSDYSHRSVPRVPTSIRYVSTTSYLGFCNQELFGAAGDITYQVLDQFGKPFTYSGFQVREKLSNEYGAGPDGRKLTGEVEPLTRPFNPGLSKTDPWGQFHDYPYGGCGNLPVKFFAQQQAEIFYEGTWDLLSPEWSTSMTLLPGFAFLSNSLGQATFVHR